MTDSVVKPAPTEASAPTVSNGETSPLRLDIPRLHSLPSEQQGPYLLNFSATLVHHVDALDAERASAEQAPLKQELLQIINLSTPPPTRVIRNNVARCFAGIFGKGNRRLLYESINELVAILQAGKEKDVKAKHAAATSLGALFEAAGDSAVSLSALACTTALKAIKGASSDAGYRAAIFKSFGRIAKGMASALDEDVARTVWKQARNAVSGDKALLVQANACYCLEQLVRTTPYFDNSNDFEKLQTALFKAMESSSVTVRHAAASSLAAELVKTYSESANPDAVPKIKKPRKAKKAPKGEELEDEIERTASPVLERPATALSHTLQSMLRVLSTQYSKAGITNRGRAGIAVCYVKIIKALGESIVEQRYADISRHLFNDLLAHPSLFFNKYRQLITRRFVHIILDDVIGGMLGETAQLNACRHLLNDIIKDYPQVIKDRPEPSKHVLTGAVAALLALIKRLGAAIGNIAELCREGLLQVLQHPNFTVQVYTARALRAFVLACPQQLLPTVTICMNSVNRELGLLAGPRRAPRRCVGVAHGLAAVLSSSSQQPLFGSVDVYARVLQQATTLLKSSGSSDLRISSCQLQVAWIMIGGLMSLGPSFVKIHLSQLMLLWKNALARPVPKDRMGQRSMIELSFLAHVRDCALGSIRAFLTYNQRLLTSDVSRRLSSMLENAAAFLQSLPEKKTSDDPANRLSSALQLQDYEVMVKRRVFQCFSQLLILSPPGSVEVTAHSIILPLAVALFSNVEYATASSLSAAIATASASFESIYDVGDNQGYGLTGLVRGLDIIEPLTRRPSKHWTTRGDKEDEIDQVIKSPIGQSSEYDATYCYVESDDVEAPMPPATEAVNAAILTFSLSVVAQAPRIQESTLEQMLSSLSSPALQKDPARRAAIAVNVALALMAAVKVATGEVDSVKGNMRSPLAEKGLQSLLHICIKDVDESVRLMAATALGKLCSYSDNAFVAAEVTFLTETIVNDREPHVRAGCAVALAQIHAALGGMAAGFHMKSMVGILMSLAADTHPLVHFWALDSLAQVAESAGLNFSAFVSSTLGMLNLLYVSDGHNSETAIVASSNMSLDLPVTAAIARGADSTVNVLGPDLQDMTKARDMILSMVRLFAQEPDTALHLESLRCYEHLSLYAPGYVEIIAYVHQLQKDMDSSSSEVAVTALHGLSTLMRRDATDIIRTAKTGLEEQLWEVLNTYPAQSDVQRIFINWLQQTGPSDPAEWIQRCNKILTKTKAKTEQPKTAVVKDTPAVDLQDDEVAGFAVATDATKDDEGEKPSSTQELMRWQVRLFAMECLHNLIAIINKEATVVEDSPGEAALQARIADIIRIAFSASTAGVAALRVVGMRIIDQILKMFGRTPDPDFPEVMLLEQYQAQISSALTPAFAADSSPELAAAAVSVCATFIATGIVTDVERMGRILKVLVSALDSFSQESESASIGELKSLSTNAQVMVRMAVFSAWAELQIASAEQKYLVNVIKLHIVRLVPLWLSSLREYSRLRFEPDISATIGTLTLSSDVDMVYAALNRQTLLNFYQDAWLSLVDAIASLIEEDSDFVFDAMDGKLTTVNGEGGDASGEANGIRRKSTGINYREEPVAFFFVLFGLAFESLAVRSNEDAVLTRQRNLDILRALQKILRPSVSGNAVYQEAVFSEFMDLLARMVLTESCSVQSIVVEIARNLCLVHPSSRQGQETSGNGEQLSEDIEQLFELTRIIVLVLAGVVPGLSDTPVSGRLETSEEAIALVRIALQALVDVSEVFPSIIRSDLHATILHIFVTILGTAACQTAVVPQSLPIFRRFIVSIVDEQSAEAQDQLRTTLSRMLLVLKNAQKRESEASLTCEKNTLLAITVLLSAASTAFPSEDPLITRFIQELCECVDAPMTSRVASGCLRTLLLSNIAAPRLFAHAVHFLSQPSDLDGVKENRSLMAQTLTLAATKLPMPQRSAAVAVTMTVVVQWAEADGVQVYQDAASRLLECAAAGNAAFRAVVTQIDPERKLVLEKVLKSRTSLQQRSSEVNGDREPTIALKMDF